MADGYDVALFVHVVGVFGVAGAVTAFWFAMSWMRHAESTQELRALAPMAFWSDRMFPIAAIIVFVAGAYMVEDVNWGWGTGWINTSLIALVVIGVGGGLLMTPRVGAIRDAVDGAPDGPVSDQVRAKLNDPILWGTLHAFTLGLFAIIWNMTTKPADSQAGIVILLAFVLGAASAIPMARRA